LNKPLLPNQLSVTTTTGTPAKQAATRLIMFRAWANLSANATG